jgi:hypothetical protein
MTAVVRSVSSNLEEGNVRLGQKADMGLAPGRCPLFTEKRTWLSAVIMSVPTGDIRYRVQSRLIDAKQIDRRSRHTRALPTILYKFE